MDRIQAGQGKALEKITNHNDMPAQIKQLTDQLKLMRDRNRELDERLRREEKAGVLLQERFITLEEKYKDLKARGAKLNGEPEDVNDLGPSNMELQYRLQEAQRINQILSKSRDVQSKTLNQVKSKMEKIVDKYKQQNDYLQNQLVEKQKELKLYQLRLKGVSEIGGGAGIAGSESLKRLQIESDLELDRNPSEVSQKQIQAKYKSERASPLPGRFNSQPRSVNRINIETVQGGGGSVQSQAVEIKRRLV